MFFKTGVLKNFPNFTGKNVCWSFFLTKLQDFRPANLLKRDSNTDVLLQNLGNFSEHLCLQNTSGGFCLSSINFHKQSMFFLMTPKNQFCVKEYSHYLLMTTLKKVVLPLKLIIFHGTAMSIIKFPTLEHSG